MKYSYKAYDKVGHQVGGLIDASTPAEATDSLRRQGLFVTEVIEAGVGSYGVTTDGGGSGSGSGTVGGAIGSQRVATGQRMKFQATFARQLHGLTAGGTPLVQALQTIERQTELPRWRGVVVALRGSVERGSSLSVAMQQQPGWFDTVCRSLVAAGESSGNMAPMLERLSALARKQLHLRQSVVGAMVYPCLLVCVAVVTLLSMLVFVLPRFTGLFKTLGAPLPPTTAVLMDLSTFVQNYWWAVAPPLVLAAVAARFWSTSPTGRVTIQTWLLKAPRVNKVIRSLMSARLARLLGVLLESKVPLLEALQLARESAGNVHYEQLLARAEDVVSRGESMSDAFAASDLFGPSVVEAMRTGERSGQIGGPLLQVAEFLDEENEIVVKALTSLLEPLILVFLGVVIGGVALSMFLPLFDLAASASGGG